MLWRPGIWGGGQKSAYTSRKHAEVLWFPRPLLHIRYDRLHQVACAEVRLGAKSKSPGGCCQAKRSDRRKELQELIARCDNCYVRTFGEEEACWAQSLRHGREAENDQRGTKDRSFENRVFCPCSGWTVLLSPRSSDALSCLPAGTETVKSPL